MKKTKILIVDDNETNVEILVEILQDDYDLELAYSGTEAIQKAQQCLPDIILLDIMMPDINGYEVCQTIRKMGNLKYAKIIMVSAKAMLQERLQGYEAGVDDYIIKPFDQEELLAKVKVFSRLKSAEELEQTLRTALQKAQKAEEVKNVFLANMSHEIRTPMNIIIGFTDCLLDEDMCSEWREHLTMIKKSGEHLLHLICDILDLSKIEAGKLDIDFAESSLEKISSDIESSFSAMAIEKNIDFKVIRSDTLPENIYTDTLRLKQCLFNLINNGLKFTRQGYVRLKIFAENGNVHFDVEDTGIGISAEKIETILEPFVQAEDTTTREFGGTGLGLAITSHLVELLNGQLTIRSVEGKGSVFSIILPICKEENIPNDKYSTEFENIKISDFC